MANYVFICEGHDKTLSWVSLRGGGGGGEVLPGGMLSKLIS